MKSLGVVLILQFWAVLAFAQQKEKYQGEYRWNNLQGIAEFEYIPVSKDSMVLDGAFGFLSQSEPESRVFEKNRVKGTYSKNIKTGPWTYRHETYHVRVRDVVDFELEAEISGTQINLEAIYKNGIPDGKWVYEEIFFNGQTKETRTDTDELLFKEGVLSDKLEIRFRDQNQSQFIRGKFLSNGVMDGEWVLVYAQDERLVSEVRNYQNGFLLSLKKRDLISDRVLEEVIFYETLERLKKIESGTNAGFRLADRVFGLEYADGFLSSSPKAKAQEAANAFMSQFIQNLLRYENAYLNEKGQLVQVPIHTRRMVYEFSRNQQRMIEILPNFFHEIKSNASRYLKDESFELNKNSSAAMARAFAVYQTLFKKLESMEGLIQLLRTKNIQFHNVSQILPNHPELFQSEIPFSYTFAQSEQQDRLLLQLETFELDFFEGFENYLRQIGQVLQKEQQIVDESLFVIRQDSELRDVEKQISQSTANLEAMYPENSENEYLQAVREQVLQSYISQLKDKFSSEYRFEIKKEIGQRILNQFVELEAAYGELLELDTYPKQVDQAYMEEVFNPFTYSRYDQRIKPKLYDSYEELLGYYKTQLKTSKSGHEVRRWIRKIRVASLRLLELKDQDTKKLERSLNKRNQISKIESLLGL
jgi:hypothetical protein